MQKNYRCPGCHSTVEFLPKMGKMCCSYCGNLYTIEELTAKENSVEPAKGNESPNQKDPKDNSMKMRILRCSSCGAELAVNDVEVSSFCAYCGQATVVLDRVDDYLKPDYIMPFRVTKEEAEETIRSRISSGFYVPNEIKHFEVEKLRGIYVPFWLYDVLYGDEQFWRYSEKHGKTTVTRYSRRLADCHFVKLTADASKNLNDASSQRLEPYDMEELERFQPMYLSGFYADRFDVGQDEVKDVAVARAKEMFDESMKETVRSGARMVYSNPLYEVTGAEYALLPAWFLTFRQDGVPYTVLVNGQTKKMVSTLPCVKWKAGLTFAILAAVLCGILIPPCGLVYGLVLVAIQRGGNLNFILGLISLGAILLIGVWVAAIKRFKVYLQGVKLTRSGITSRFVGERQDR